MLRLRWVRGVLPFLFVLGCMASKTPAPLNHRITTWWPDPSTGLMWTGTNIDGVSAWKNFADSNKACNELEVDGRSGWRLPTIDELDAVRVTSPVIHPDGTHLDVGNLKWTYVAEQPLIWSNSPAPKQGEYYTQRVNGLSAPEASKPSDHWGHVAFCVRAMEPDVLQAAKAAPITTAVSDLATLQAYAPLLKAQAAYNADQFQSCIDQIRQGLAIKPDIAVAYYGLGLSEGMLGQWDQAVADLEKVKKLGLHGEYALAWATNNQKAARKGVSLDPNTNIRPAWDASL